MAFNWLELQGGAVSDGGRIGPGDSRCGLEHSQRAVNQRDLVIGLQVVRVEQARHDGVGPRRAAGGGAATVGGGDVVTVLHAGNCAGEDRVGLAITRLALAAVTVKGAGNTTRLTLPVTLV